MCWHTSTTLSIGCVRAKASNLREGGCILFCNTLSIHLYTYIKVYIFTFCLPVFVPTPTDRMAPWGAAQGAESRTLHWAGHRCRLHPTPPRPHTPQRAQACASPRYFVSQGTPHPRAATPLAGQKGQRRQVGRSFDTRQTLLRWNFGMI